MNQKKITNIYMIILLSIVLAIVIVTGVAGYFTFVQKPKSAPMTTTPSVITPKPGVTPTLSEDHKDITADTKILLAIDDDAIFNFFKTKSQLCDEINITTTPDRKMFCEDKTTFKSQTRFTSIVSSTDNLKIGFTIESDTLSPDKVAGIFYPTQTTNKVNFLTSYYLGNEFISFSPNSTNFVYKSGCWEGICAFYIKNTQTLTDKIDFIPTEADMRGNYKFISWLSDNKIEYTLNNESKQASF